MKKTAAETEELAKKNEKLLQVFRAAKNFLAAQDKVVAASYVSSDSCFPGTRSSSLAIRLIRASQERDRLVSQLLQDERAKAMIKLITAVTLCDVELEGEKCADKEDKK